MRRRLEGLVSAATTTLAVALAAVGAERAGLGWLGAPAARLDPTTALEARALAPHHTAALRARLVREGVDAHRRSLVP